MEGSVLSFLKTEWKMSDTGLANWASSLFCFVFCFFFVLSSCVFLVPGFVFVNLFAPVLTRASVVFPYFFFFFFFFGQWYTFMQFKYLIEVPKQKQIFILFLPN